MGAGPSLKCSFSLGIYPSPKYEEYIHQKMLIADTAKHTGDESPKIGRGQKLRILEEPIHKHNRRKNQADCDRQPCPHKQCRPRHIAHSYTGTAGAHWKLIFLPEEAALRHLVTAKPMPQPHQLLMNNSRISQSSVSSAHLVPESTA